MFGVFRNIDLRGGHTRRVERGRGVNSSDDARHCSVLSCKYFMLTLDYNERRRQTPANFIIVFEIDRGYVPYRIFCAHHVFIKSIKES
jgi:hypothetical protein